MSSRPLYAPSRRSSRVALGLPLAFTLALGACAEKEGSTDNTVATVGSGDPTAPTGTGTMGSATTQASAEPTGGSTSAAASTSGPVGSGTAPGTASSATGSVDDPGGMGGTGNTGAEVTDDGMSGDAPTTEGSDSADDSDDATSGPTGNGTDPEASGGAGGTGGATSDDSSAGGADTGGGDTGNPPSDECTRDLLDGLLDDYFTALSAGDAASLPLASNAKFTENAEEGEIGTSDFWLNAGDVKYSQRALDTTACSVAAQAVIAEGTTDRVVGIRLKVDAGELTEIETIVFREGDYTASYSVPSDPQAIIDAADAIGWADDVPEADRASREELTAWVDKYFRAFPNGVCNVSASCRRLENGGGDFDCDGFSGCGGDAASNVMVPRLIIVDEVRGVAAGLANFDYMADGHLDMHMIKMVGGEVLAVHAILRDTDGQSGWD